jgi:flagellar biogenesis protein FliO
MMRSMLIHWKTVTKSLREKTSHWRKHMPQQLRLGETLSLGERRFVAVVEFERQKFLIGGNGHGVSLLANLQTPSAGSSADEEVTTWAFGTEGGLVRIPSRVEEQI